MSKAEAREKEHNFANEQSKKIFGIDEINWLGFWERTHLFRKLKLIYVCPIERAYMVNCTCMYCVGIMKE